MSLSVYGGFLCLLAEFGGEAGHLVLERFAVILDFGGVDVPTRREDWPWCRMSSSLPPLLAGTNVTFDDTATVASNTVSRTGVRFVDVPKPFCGRPLMKCS